MKRMLFTIVVAAVSFLAFTNAANAQSDLDLRATVPFSFVANNHVFLAGEYEVTQLRPSLIVLHNMDNRESVAALTQYDRAEKGTTGNPALIFHHYGDQYFLSQVIGNSGDEVRQLRVTAAERKLIKGQGKPQLAVIRVTGPGFKSGD